MTGPGHAIVILLRHIGLLHNNSGTYAVSTPLKCQVNSCDVGPTLCHSWVIARFYTGHAIFCAMLAHHQSDP